MSDSDGVSEYHGVDRTRGKDNAVRGYFAFLKVMLLIGYGKQSLL